VLEVVVPWAWPETPEFVDELTMERISRVAAMLPDTPAFN
jgi:hypothetical protein